MRASPSSARYTPPQERIDRRRQVQRVQDQARVDRYRAGPEEGQRRADDDVPHENLVVRRERVYATPLLAVLE